MPRRQLHPTAPLIVRKTIKVGGEVHEPGARFDRALVSARLLGKLYDQKKLDHAPIDAPESDQGVANVSDARSDEAGQVEIPEDWANLHLFSRLALARKITPNPVKTSDEANLVIAGEVARRGELSGN
jgi:hypothetical protein